MYKLLKYSLFAALVPLLASCLGKYSLKGSTDGFYNGEQAYIKVDSGGVWHTVDSCDILHGCFEMSGEVDAPFLTSLFIGEEAIMPVIIESGDIVVNLSMRDANVSGTNLNDQLSRFIEDKDVFERRIMEIERRETALILDGHTAESAAAEVREAIAAVGDSMNLFVEKTIRDHYNTVLGPCIFQLLCSAMPYPLMTKQVEGILADAPQSFKDNHFVKMFVAAAEENMQRMQK
ncbi:MAG: DUF4369 domain-containing protein [Bacteroidaceae bacterium]|nr:DUF4369 domain-containing protein [Bacteroidaceae bacterium]